MAENTSLYVETFPVGPLGCNCTILGCHHTKEAVVIDPGGDEERILGLLKDHNLTVKEIIHTHAHFDHCLATKAVAEAHAGATVRMHEDDLFMYKMLAAQGRMFGIPVDGDIRPIDEHLGDDQRLPFGRHMLKVLHTPGHSPGSCCFEVGSAEKNYLFSGDTLFAGGVGRTDLWGGSYDQLMDSIKNRLFKLDRETHVVPGHGGPTSIELETKMNPFLQ